MTRYQNQSVINFLLEQLALVVPTMSNKVGTRRRGNVGRSLAAVVCFPSRPHTIVVACSCNDI